MTSLFDEKIVEKKRIWHKHQGLIWFSRSVHSLVLGDEFTIANKEYKSVYTLKGELRNI